MLLEVLGFGFGFRGFGALGCSKQGRLKDHT